MPIEGAPVQGTQAAGLIAIVPHSRDGLMLRSFKNESVPQPLSVAASSFPTTRNQIQSPDVSGAVDQRWLPEASRVQSDPDTPYEASSPPQPQIR